MSVQQALSGCTLCDFKGRVVVGAEDDAGACREMIAFRWEGTFFSMIGDN
jgi:hypothetical protein